MLTSYDPSWLERAMAEAGVQTGALAKASGISRAQIQRIRNGSPPRMDTMIALNGALERIGASA